MPARSYETVAGSVVHAVHRRVIRRYLMELFLDHGTWDEQASCVVLHHGVPLVVPCLESASHLAWASGGIFPLKDLGAGRPFSWRAWWRWAWSVVLTLLLRGTSAV